MNSPKPSIKETAIIEIVSEWIGVEFGVFSNPLRMQSSMSSSSSFMEGFSVIQTNSSGLSDILQKYPIYKSLLTKCKQHPSCNIFHQKVTNLLSTSFRTKSEKIINFIYKENNIIEETVTSMKDFKKNGYFGYFMIIIEIYTAQRVDTETVLHAIESNQRIWN